MKERRGPRIEKYNRAWLLDARRKAKKTQREVAVDCGTTQGTYNLIEQGLRMPSVRLGLQIAKCLSDVYDEPKEKAKKWTEYVNAWMTEEKWQNEENVI